MVLRVIVHADGQVGDIRVFKSRGHKILDHAGIRPLKNGNLYL